MRDGQLNEAHQVGVGAPIGWNIEPLFGIGVQCRALHEAFDGVGYGQVHLMCDRRQRVVDVAC